MVTNEELQELLRDCPVLYHMAEHGSWPSIRDRGLLSTTALLDLYEITGERRVEIEATRRPTSVNLENPTLGLAVVRDQIPMDDKGLRRALPEDWTPECWYRLLNGRVFFWLSRERLLRLLGADAYRSRRHDVIEIETASLVSSCRDEIWLCPINSGCTKPFPHPRGGNTFSRIPDYPYSYWRGKRKKGERVVELAVDYSVPHLSRHVLRVVEMMGSNETNVLYERATKA